MGLGNRDTSASHDTAAMRRVAVVSADYADFREKQPVMTCDGLPGIVAAIEDGPYPSTEAYRVELDDGMGGGLYTSGQLQALPEATAGEHQGAASDYPELSDILAQRPDIAGG